MPNLSTWRLFQDLKKSELADLNVALAKAYYLKGDQPALDDLLKAHPEAVAAIGDLYAADKNWERAIAEYTKAITPETKDAKLLAKRAEAYEKQKQWDLAVADWTRASQQQPDVAFQRFKPAGAGSWQCSLQWRRRFDGGCRWDLGIHNDGRDRNQLARSGLSRRRCNWRMEPSTSFASR